MSQAPLDDLTMEGYEAPRVVQFNVFLDNRVGRLLELVELFEKQSVCIAGLSIMDSADYAVIRLVCSKSGVARRHLHDHHVPFSEEEVLAVGLSHGRTLASLCRSLLQAEINMDYAYPLLIQPSGVAAVIVHTDEPDLTAQVLKRSQFLLLGEADLCQPGRSPGSSGEPSI